jgi:hypothetical protein
MAAGSWVALPVACYQQRRESLGGMPDHVGLMCAACVVTMPTARHGETSPRDAGEATAEEAITRTAVGHFGGRHYRQPHTGT